MQPNGDPVEKDDSEETAEPVSNDALLSPEARRRVSTESFNEIVRTVRDVAAKTADTISTALDRALAVPDTVRHSLILRLDDETLKKIDSMVDAGLFAKRDEAAQFLIFEGIKHQTSLFDQIHAKLTEIERLKNDLKKLAGNE